MICVPLHLVRTATRCLVAVGLLLLLVVPITPTRTASAQASGWVLTSFCTPTESYPAFRQFRVRNSTGAADDVVLRNQSINQQIAVTAPPGDSFWLVPAGPGTNTVQLLVDNVVVGVKASNNYVCAVLAGNALCDPVTGNTTVTWTLRNNDGGPATITNGGGLTFSPNPVPGNSSSTATEIVPPSATNQVDTLTVILDLGRGVESRPSASVNIGVCVPPGVTSFTFTKTPSVTTAEVGQTITYTYSGRNTGTVPLEVVGLVDDRLGVVITDPSVVTLVNPGETISRTVTYVVKPTDAATTIVNNAVVVVRTIVQGVAGDPQTGVATAQVVVPEQVIVEPPQPPGTTVPGTTVPGATVPGTLPATGNSEDRSVVLAFIAAGLIGLGLIVRRAARTD
ncbi:MAG TPA: hypothetical protein VES40_10625 [Ilumatobacteraceae bacterium]|nr:hypothetical protein [Ilumatobacteraceae bacterium]